MEINDIMDLLIQNEIEATKSINMVPSENFASSFTRLPLITDVNNRYFFNDTVDKEQWNFKGAKEVYTVETDIAIPLLKELSRSKFVNIRPLSGLSAMQLVLKSYGEFVGENVLLVSPDQGGHYATSVVAEGFGLNVDFITGNEPHQVDYELLENKLKSKTIDFIYIDQSDCLFPIDVKKLTTVVKRASRNTIVHVDASHWMGLVLGNAMSNPLECGADSFGGSTHKTFPGPQKGIFCTNNEEISKNIKATQFNMISSHHFGSVTSLALALYEFKHFGGSQYALNIIDNTKLLAELLYSYNYDVKGKDYGFTSGHQIWISTNNIGINSFTAADRLYQVGIRVNVFNSLPGYPEDIMRLGVNEITRHGANKEDICELAAIMDSAIKETEKIEVLKERVKKIRENKSNKYGFSSANDCLYEKSIKLLKVALDH